jgi:hypothetical protein
MGRVDGLVADVKPPNSLAEVARQHAGTVETSYKTRPGCPPPLGVPRMKSRLSMPKPFRI